VTGLTQDACTNHICQSRHIADVKNEPLNMPVHVNIRLVFEVNLEAIVRLIHQD
jgi:hypothetical protein